MIPRATAFRAGLDSVYAGAFFYVYYFCQKSKRDIPKQADEARKAPGAGTGS